MTPYYLQPQTGDTFNLSYTFCNRGEPQIGQDRQFLGGDSKAFSHFAQNTGRI